MKKVILKLVLSLLLASGVLVNLPVYGRGQFTNLWSYVGPDLSNTVSLERVAFVTAVAIVTGMLFYWKQWKQTQSKPLEEGDIPQIQAKPNFTSEQECTPEIIVDEQEAFDILASVRGQLDTLWVQVEAQELPFDVAVSKFNELKREYGVVGGLVGKLVAPKKRLYDTLSNEYQRNLTGVDPQDYYSLVGLSNQDGACLTSAQMLEEIEAITQGVEDHSKEFVQRQLTYIFREPWSKKFYDLWLQGENELIQGIKRISGRDLLQKFLAINSNGSSFIKLSNYVAEQQARARKPKAEQEWELVGVPE